MRNLKLVHQKYGAVYYDVIVINKYVENLHISVRSDQKFKLFILEPDHYYEFTNSENPKLLSTNTIYNPKSTKHLKLKLKPDYCKYVVIITKDQPSEIDFEIKTKIRYSRSCPIFGGRISWIYFT